MPLIYLFINYLSYKFLLLGILYRSTTSTTFCLTDNVNFVTGPQNFLLIAKRTELRLVSLDTPDHTAVVLPISKIQQAVVIEFDPVEGFVYWTDQNLKLIKRARLDGSGKPETLYCTLILLIWCCN